MNSLDKLILALVCALGVLMVAAECEAAIPEVSESEQLANLTITPAIPGGQPFDQTIDLPTTPEPGMLLLTGAAIFLLSHRHAR